VAYHTLQFYDPKDGEDAGMLGLRREVSAVTAACMLTKKSCWEEVGGMDETGLAVAFNDVDYCLKLRSRGKRIVWTPDAKLIHRESVSRKSARGPNQKWNFQQEERLMLERWHEQLKNDPFRSPNLSLLGEDFALETYPRF
jgi:GT2 family glycosyltransferase